MTVATPESQGAFVTKVAGQIGLTPEQCQEYAPTEAWQLKNRLWQGKARSQRSAVGFVFLTDAQQIDTAVSNSLERLAPAPGGFNAMVLVERDSSGDWCITKVVEKKGASVGVRLKQFFPNLEILPVVGPAVEKLLVKTGALVDDQVGEIVGQLQSSPNLILQGPPGTGKSFLAQRVCEHLAGAQDVAPFQLSNLLRGANGDLKSLTRSDWFVELPLIWERVQLHPGYTYDDFVRGRALLNDGNGSRIDSVDRVMPQMCAVAAARGARPTLLILEEVNRCSLASVLGDLIVAIDPAHRGEAVHLQISPPSDGGAGVGTLLAVPYGLKLLGTMNTADRSIALVDYAIRRRFRFLDVLPDREIIREYYRVQGVAADGERAAAVFDKITSVVSEERIRLGQSYFLCAPGERWPHRFANRIIYEVFPMLREYLAEGRRLSATIVDLGASGQLDFAQSAADPVNTVDRDVLVNYLTTSE